MFDYYSSSSPCNLPVNLIKLVNIQHSWSICLSQDGEFLAVLQENSIEIRSRRDKYVSLTSAYMIIQADPSPCVFVCFKLSNSGEITKKVQVS